MTTSQWVYIGVGAVVGAVLGLLLLDGFGIPIGAILGGALAYAVHGFSDRSGR